MSKLNDIKVIFVDIDGTLTNQNKKVTEKTSNVIKKVVDKGIKVVICSGRYNKYVEAKSITSNASSQIISNNGAQIYDYNKHKILYQKPIDKSVLRKVINYLNDNEYGCILNTKDVRCKNIYLKRKIEDDAPQFRSLDDLEFDDYLQIVIEAKTYEKMDKIVEYINKQEDLSILNYSESYIRGNKNESRYYIDVDMKDVNKGKAIKEYLRLYNLDKKNALCFGDHINDLDMFNSCKYKVAMENASDDLKSEADFVTLSNENDGVASFLENYIL